MPKKIMLLTVIAFINLFVFTGMISFANEESKFKLPSHVLDISKENTFPNDTEDYEEVEASEEAKELIKTANVEIMNPDLIQLLNETSIRPSPIGIGYRGMISLGRWPLLFESEDTSVNWEYQIVNKSEINNTTDSPIEMTYTQIEDREISGALTSKIAKPEMIRRMIIEQAQDKTKLPLTYQTTVGSNTKTASVYQVEVQKIGYLEAYVPAILEKGEVTFGEVYIELRGTKKNLVVKNVTKQHIGAWLPIQNHLAYSFQLK